jgi:hypothetical protein
VAELPDPELPEADLPEADRKPARRSRRVRTDPAPGTDPKPVAEPARHELTENDERLKAEKPPHY